jgi:hypothetical protein
VALVVEGGFQPEVKKMGAKIIDMGEAKCSSGPNIIWARLTIHLTGQYFTPPMSIIFVPF